MGFISNFEPLTLKTILRVSNYWAAANRNQYPVNMTNVLETIYDWLPCPCNSQCQCKQYKCTHHYIRKAKLSFEETISHFLSCFVDVKMRDAVSSGRKEGRGAKAVEAIEYFKRRWDQLPAPLTTHLLCTEWFDNKWGTLARSFEANNKTIYKAKWLTLLALDTFVAYDTGSVRLLNREYGGDTYFDLLSNIRADLLRHLQNNNISMISFRLYDDPHEFFTEIPSGHSRPIGNIVDKLFLTL